MKLQTAMAPRLGTALVWGLALVAGGYWTQAVLSAARRPTGGPLPAVLPTSITSPVDLARLLGASPPVIDVARRPSVERWTLAGVIADGNGQGAALISVDGKPARAFPVGAQIAPGSVLVAVGPKEALIADDRHSPVRTILQLTAQLVPIAVPDNLEPAKPGALPAVASPATAPASAQAVPTGPPPRADSRRQPPASLKREDRRGP